MATSSKVQFKLSTLREKALETIDLKIAQAQLEVDSAESPEAFEARVRDWRANTEQAIIRMADRLQTKSDTDDQSVSDYELDKFRSKGLRSMPEQDRWEMRDAQRTLERRQARRLTIDAKSASLVPDADGNVSLTKTQLDEFFGL